MTPDQVYAEVGQELKFVQILTTEWYNICVTFESHT